jgi:hypothetical protein
MVKMRNLRAKLYKIVVEHDAELCKIEHCHTDRFRCVRLYIRCQKQACTYVLGGGIERYTGRETKVLESIESDVLTQKLLRIIEKSKEVNSLV